MKEQPVDGFWYWTRYDKGAWFPALRASDASGGWTNGDTWEDFQKRVVDWILIPYPVDTES